MRHTFFRLGYLLGIVILLLGCVTGCQKEYADRGGKPAEDVGLGLEEGAAPTGATVVSAVARTPGIGLQQTPVSPATTATAEISTPAAAEVQASPEPGFVIYAVKKGDTLLAIAVAHGTTTEAIIEANNLQDPSTLAVGQVLKIPVAPGVTPQPTSASQPVSGACGTLVNSGGCRYKYTVKPGDWIWQIARTCGVDPYALLRANGLTVETGRVIQPGMVLCIP